MAASLARAIIVITLCLILTQSGSLRAADPAQRELLETFIAEFMDITPGEGKFPQSFQQGALDEKSPHPPRQVTLTRPFAIARYEVPQNLHESVMGSNPSRWKGPRNSAESMSWNDAVEFCTKATTLLRAEKLIDETEVIRLPSESEWEYACRAGTTTAYSFGDDAQAEDDAAPRATLLDAHAWHHGNAAGNDPAVGVLKPNPWGLYDIHGYLWEYCADDWHPPGDAAPTDGSAWIDEPRAARRVIRGGSWKDEFSHLRSDARRPVEPDFRDDAIGFRCVKARE